jgi:hypothetical protein
MISSGSSAPDTLAELLRRFIRDGMERAWFCLPAKINKFEPDAQRVEVQPLLKRMYIENNEKKVMELAPIVRVPVIFPEGGGFSIRWTLEPGDRVIIVCADRQMDLWLAGQGQQVDPFSRRTHSLDDAIAIPLAPRPWGDPLPNLGDGDLVAGRKDGSGELRIKPSGNVEMGAEEAEKKGIARLEDEVKSTAAEDSGLWAWIGAIHALIVGLEAVPGAGTLVTTFKQTIEEAGVNQMTGPTSMTGKITSASEKSSTE